MDANAVNRSPLEADPQDPQTQKLWASLQARRREASQAVVSKCAELQGTIFDPPALADSA